MTPESDRYICTPGAPWTPDKGHAVHPDGKIVGGCVEGCCDDYHCPTCGVSWRIEAPQ
jgi:hypothetical protein